MKFTIDAQRHSMSFTDENGELRLGADVGIYGGNPEIGLHLYDGRRALELYMSPAEASRLSAWLAARAIESNARGAREPYPSQDAAINSMDDQT